VKGGSNAPKKAVFGYRMQNLRKSKTFLGRCPEIVLQLMYILVLEIGGFR